MAEYKVGAVTPLIAQRVWPQIEGYVSAAIKRSNMERAYLPLDIFAFIQRGEMLLWLVATDSDIAAAFVTRINEFPRCKTCNIFLLGGRGMNAWLPQLIHQTEDYAKKMGCIGMQIEGRDGWVRAAGYRKTGTVMFKELSDG